MSSSTETAHGVVFRFDRFELLTETGELRKSGMRIHLAPQPLRVLQLLIERAGEVVTREEIQQALWVSGTFVDFEQGINTAIRRIRFVLNDNAETPRFLQTLPRRGYCFVAPVERVYPSIATSWIEATLPPLHLVEPLPIAEPPRRRVPLAAALAVAALTLFAERGSHLAAEPPEPALRIAVAPLRVEDARKPPVDPQRVSDELHTILGGVQPHRIRVVDARSTADLRIETSLHDGADITRVDARLVDARTGKEVWNETMNRKAGEVEDFPLEIGLRVTRAVTERYIPPPREEPVVRTAVSPRALELYRQARALRGGPSARSDLDGSLATFDKAIALEPRFAEAWSGIGNIWTERAGGSLGATRMAALAKARVATERAIALDPRCPEALNDYARQLMMSERKYAAAEVWLRRAVESDPEYLASHLTMAVLLGAMGQNEKAIAAFRRAQDLAPNRHVPSPHLAFLYLMGHRPDDARAEYHASRLVTRVPFVANWGLMWSSMMAGRWDDAAHWLAAVLQEPVELGDDPDRAAAFRRELRRIEPRLLAMERAGRIDSYSLAAYYAMSQDNDRALAALDRAIEQKSLQAIYAWIDPRLEILRSDPRFDERLERLGFDR